MQPVNPINLRPVGLASTKLTNELAVAVNALAPVSQSGPVSNRGRFVETLFAKIDAPIGGSAFRYDAYLFGFDPSTQAAAGDLTEEMLGTVSETLACEVWNFSELGRGGALQADDIVPVRKLGYRIDDQKLIVAAMAAPAATRTMLRIDNFVGLGVGKYWGMVQTRTAETFFIANSTNLSMASFYEDLDFVDVLILNPTEIPVGGHMLAANTYVLGDELDPTEDGERVFIVEGIAGVCG